MICLEEITIIEAPIERCFDLSRRVEVHLFANIHSGEAVSSPPDSNLISHSGPQPRSISSLAGNHEILLGNSQWP
jgi:hypothetical protein